MSSTTPSDGTAAASGPSKKVIGSAVVVAVIVVLGLVLSLANLLGRQTDSPTTPPPPSRVVWSAHVDAPKRRQRVRP